VVGNESGEAVHEVGDRRVPIDRLVVDGDRTHR
jgi:hypothetical protein